MGLNGNHDGEAPAPEPEQELKRFGQNCINNFFVCRFCYEEKPRGISTANYSRLHVGFTSKGLQVWCARHETNVIHLDFEGREIKGSDRVDPEDREALLERLPKVAGILEENGHEAIRAGLAVIRERLALVGYRDEDHPKGTTHAELLRSFSIELDSYLFTGQLPKDWATALKMIKVAKGEGLILPEGSERKT